MRIRKRKWEQEELEKFESYIKNPESKKGKWQEEFKNNNPIHIEIGIGKGTFISKLAKRGIDNNLNINYIGIDVEDTMLALSKRAIENEFFNITNENRDKISKTITKLSSDFRKLNNLKYGEKIPNELKDNYESFLKEKMDEELYSIYELLQEKSYERKNYPNVLIARKNADYITDIFESSDNINRIYLNFSNPWPKDKHNKRRLTHITKLKQYIEFLKEDSYIFMKTDDDMLFEASLEYFKELNLEIQKLTYDLTSEDIFESIGGNIVTEHEEMFTKEGKKIKAVIVKVK